MARKFPEELDIRLDNNYNKIINKETIIKNLELINTQDEIAAVLEYYLRYLENVNSLDKNDLKEILTSVKDRENSLKNANNSLQSQFNEVKDKNNNLKNISIVDTSKYDNDKINGFKRNVTYIEIEQDGKKELFEVTNINAVKNLLGNPEQLKLMSENEIIDFLKEHSKELQSTYIDTRPSDVLTGDTLNDELNRIHDPYVRDAFIKEENLVLEERVQVKKYVDENFPGTRIEYGLNSYGERIYMVEDKIIKFKTIGDTREMQILDKDEKLENNVDASFEKYSEINVSEENIKLEEYNNIKDFANDDSINTLNKTIEAISIDVPVSDHQIEFLKKFIQLYMIEYSKTDSIIPGELTVIFDKYYDYAKNYSKFLNAEIEEMLNKKEEIDKVKEMEKNNRKVLELTPVEKAGFISVAIILEASVIIGGIIAILALVKK